MPLSEINWNSIKVFKGTQAKGFEQLCFQIALRQFELKGTFTEVDDTGGGDGVEFYLAFPDGAEWGWQAKFYGQSVRLSESNRKSKIVTSLKRSLTNHPKLTKWILCTNSQFTRGEQQWLRETLSKNVPRGRKVEIEHWSEGKISSWLDDPHYSGIKSAFLNSLELSSDWFAEKFNKFRSLVAEKFREKLHTKDHDLYYDYLGPILINEDFVNRIRGNLTRAQSRFKDFREGVSKLKALSLANIEWQEVQIKYLDKCYDFQQCFESQVPEFEKIIQKITANGIAAAKAIDIDIYLRPLNKIFDDLKKIKKEKQIKYIDGFDPEKDALTDNLSRAIRTIHNPEYYIDRLMAEIGYFFRDISMDSNHSIHILGTGGIGKTHICTSIASERIEKGLPAIFIPAVKFTSSSSIESQCLQLLDIRSKYSFDNLLDTLNILGKIYNSRVPIIIDGLNESVNDQGALNIRWSIDLPGLEAQLRRYSHLVLITSCRQSYQSEIWKNDPGAHFVEYRGLTNDSDIHEIVTKYFEAYHIHADLTYLSLSHFRRPLFVLIFCETKAKLGEDVHLQLGSDSIYDVMGQFITRCDNTVLERLKHMGHAPLRRNKELATVMSSKLAKALWEDNSRSIDFDKYFEYFRDTPDQNYLQSRPKALVDEGLLLIRDWMEQKDKIGFTYDVLAGYCIAGYLVESHKASVKSFIFSKAFFDKLITRDYTKRHPLAEDILASFIALLPFHTGKHLLHLLPRTKKYEEVWQESFYAFFQLSGNLISAEVLKTVNRVFIKNSNTLRIHILDSASEIFFVQEHPLNFRFFSDLFFSMPLAERDACWCQFLINLPSNYLDGIVLAFEKNNKHQLFNFPEELLKNDLVAEFMAWSLASTIKAYRTAASGCLYHYGRLSTEKFLQLFERFIQVNDPYIIERSMAVCYGVVNGFCQQKTNADFVLNIVNRIYELFFLKGEKYATTHVLTRDYGSQLIEAAVKNFPMEFKNIHLRLVRKPFHFGGIRKWGTSPDKNKNDYRDGNSLIDFFFRKDKLNSIIDGDVYKENEKVELTLSKLRWRAYQLGYTFELFGEMDRINMRVFGYGRDDRLVEKFSEKYTMIGFYELAGYWEDKGLIKPYYETDYPLRRIEPDLDASFPEAQQQFAFFQNDLLGDRHIPIGRWINAKTIPDIAGILKTSSLPGIADEFVLIKGFRDQTDIEHQRQLFFQVHAVMGPKNQMAKVKNGLRNSDRHWDMVPEFHEFVFNGEYPGSDYFPMRGKESIDWVKKKQRVKVRYSKEVLFKGNRRVAEKTAKGFWDKLEKKYGYRRMTSDDFVKDIDGESNVIVIMYGGGKLDGVSLDNAIKRELKREGYTLKRIYHLRDEFHQITESIEIFIPVLNTRCGKVIAKEIALSRNLHTLPGSCDLYDESGKRASINFGYGEDKYTNNAQFLYLRKDILDAYLQQTGYDLVWLYAGERNHYLTEGLGNYHGGWKKFMDVFDYY